MQGRLQDHLHDRAGLVRDLHHLRDVELRVQLRAAELTRRREQLEAALQLAQLRRLQLAREPGGADLLADVEVLGDRPVRLLTPVGRRVPARSSWGSR